MNLVCLSGKAGNFEIRSEFNLTAMWCLPSYLNLKSPICKVVIKGLLWGLSKILYKSHYTVAGTN